MKRAVDVSIVGVPIVGVPVVCFFSLSFGCRAMLFMEYRNCPSRTGALPRFLPFLEHTEDMHDFCQREVEPMGKECEQVWPPET